MKYKYFKLLSFTFVLLMMSCATAKVSSKKKGTSATAQQKTPPKKTKKGEIKPYNKVITKDAVTDKGLFDVHKLDEKYYYEIPDSL